MTGSCRALYASMESTVTGSHWCLSFIQGPWSTCFRSRRCRTMADWGRQYWKYVSDLNSSISQLTWDLSARSSSLHSLTINPLCVGHTNTPRVYRCLPWSTTSCLLNSAARLLPPITSHTPTFQLWRICQMLEPFPFHKYYCCRIVGMISHMYQVPHSPYLAD